MKRRTLLKALPLAAAQDLLRLPLAASSVSRSVPLAESASAAAEVIVEGSARFTVLTEHCIRMEYAPAFGFVDAPTLLMPRMAHTLASHEGAATGLRWPQPPKRIPCA